jgi:hypothetical protein
MARPKTGETPNHNVRVPQWLWDAAKTEAEAEGRTVTDWINTDLRRRVAAAQNKRRRQKPHGEDQAA